MLVIPKTHVTSLATVQDAALAGEILMAAADVARQLGLEADGYRVVTNHGERAGQSVFHWHVHMLGGRNFTWPPG